MGISGAEVEEKLMKINNDFEKDFDIYRCLGDRLQQYGWVKTDSIEGSFSPTSGKSRSSHVYENLSRAQTTCSR